MRIDPSRDSGPADPARGGSVVVAMSGGVDSSVAAALLVERGYQVIGVTMNLAGGESRCRPSGNAEDARRAADRLGIRHHVADYRHQFREEVIEPFADAYLSGRTPIPCVVCNERFKFRRLLEEGRALGARALATGHYARIDTDAGTGKRRLRRARDTQKDQSYFLFRLGPEQLRHTLFPLGDLTKSEVREKARALGLGTAEKAESQEICFAADADYARLVEEIRAEGLPGEGEIVDRQGAVLGRHTGVHRFTVGQRRGLEIGGTCRLYVTEVDAERNRVVVGGLDELLCAGAEIEDVSWVAGRPPPPPVRALVKVRYRHPGSPARLEIRTDGGLRAHFDEPVRAVAPGQAAVFYDGDAVLGGGWIAGQIP
jgi:tRNA-specific 2-thiouridylase